MNLANPPVFIAALIGAMLIFLFSSLAIRAVGNAAQAHDHRRCAASSRPNPKIMTGDADAGLRDAAWTSAPRAALRQMVVPGVLVVGTPILVGIVLGPEAAAGLLMVGTIAAS